MAATPPMPPGANNFQLNGNSPQQQQQQQQLEQQQQINNNNKTPTVAEALQQHFQFKALLNADEEQQQLQLQLQRSSSSSSSGNNISRSNSNEQLEEAARPKSKLSCQCTNISIMHLFHEMKQIFPTLPDALVTQCVNENCHQRDNCIQMLQREYALHPMTVQSYPGKVLQQQQQRQAKPPTPLKPSRTAPTQPPNGNINGNTEATTPPPAIAPPARQRPTTLNLQRQLNAQLQQKIQQRQQRQQQQQQMPQQLTPTAQYKPLRRAPPLPPLPPKPQSLSSIGVAQPQILASSFSNDSSCLTSPLSSSESELSLNVSLSSPTAATSPSAAAAPTAAAAAAATSATAQLRSPVRHRSVITLQPEPPYSRDFVSNAVALSPTPPSPTSASGASTPTGRSFTSLNLTLRQPQARNGGAVPSPIDITAGPAASGNGSSGITYSSSSFDARRGTHKNFQLTVTDEGSVFTAGCVRPPVPLYAPCPPPSHLATDGSTPPSPSTAFAAPQQQQQPELSTVAETEVEAEAEAMPDVFPYPTQAQNHIVPSNYNNNHLHNSTSSDNSPSVTHMPLYEGVVPECDREAHAMTIERQKTRRDKLANALRDNKKRLVSLEQEINILTEPVPLGESERLDRDISKLNDDCQRLFNMLNADPQLNGNSPAPNSMNRQHSAPTISQAQVQPQPQPSPRPRTQRSQVPPSTLQLHSIPTQSAQSQQNYVQYPISAPCLSHQQQDQQHLQSHLHLQRQQQQQQQQQQQLDPPPTYAQYYQFEQFLQQQRQQAAAAAASAAAAAAAAAAAQPTVPQHRPNDDEEEEYLSESEVDESEEPLDMWACNLCTFRNHPQLNICEACENVRIQPAPILNREDIHITLSPGENRIIHSWILS